MNEVNKSAASQQSNTDNPVAAVNKHKAEVIALRPLTDIHESKEGATLYIDLPGVSKEHLEIDVDQNVLTVKGTINLDTKDNLEATFMDVSAQRYERRFTVGEELDCSRIEANLKQGELKLVIPRHEKHKPKTIKVKVA